MFLLEPNETPYDLRFSLFRIPIRIHPLFWLVTAILGWSAIEQGVQFVLEWIVAVLLSVLIHEMGHVLMGRAFGAEGHIVLYSFGGLAIGSNRLASRVKRIAVLFAGPLAGFLFLAVLLGAAWLRDPAATRGHLMLTAFQFGFRNVPGLDDPLDLMHLQRQNPLEASFLSDLIFINLGWGLLNLMPIWPLDGGQICREALEGASPRRGAFWALSISTGLAATIAIVSLLSANGRMVRIPFASTYTTLMFGLLAYQSFQMLQAMRAQGRWHDDPWR